MLHSSGMLCLSAAINHSLCMSVPPLHTISPALRPLPCPLTHPSLVPMCCPCVLHLCLPSQLLPPEVERVSLPRVLTSIAGLLRSRLHSSRDAAREVLGQVSLELGPEYLPHVLQ
jgi:hypothetical protein